MLTRQDMAEILEEIIRDEATNATARCTAIRTLLELRGDEPVADGPFARVDELMGRRKAKTSD
jgi:hypothetical protein